MVSHVRLVVCVLAVLFGCHAHADESRPHIVILLADDLGWADVGYHGSDIATPHLDRLAAEGTRLDRFYVCSVCSPTRAGLLTGRYPDRYGMRDGVIAPYRKHGLPPEEQTIAEVLADAGYPRRIALGKWHLGHSSKKYHPLNQGFTEFYGHYNGAIDYYTHKRDGELDWHRGFESSYDEGYSTDLLADEAVRVIKDTKPNQPLLLYVAFNAVHSPMQAPRKYLDRYGFDPDGPRLKNTGGHRGGERDLEQYGKIGNGNTVRQTYQAMTTAMDDAIGRILQALDEQGMSDNTLVLFFSDNGGVERFGGRNTPLRGQKHTTWEGGVRVPAIARWPARFAGGRSVDVPIAYVDVMPTLRRVVGLSGQSKRELDGIDVLDTIASGATGPDRVIYLGDGAVVGRQWKLKGDELFRIDRDPNETRDVADEHPGVVAKLKTQRKAFEALKVEPKESGRFETPPEWRMPGD